MRGINFLRERQVEMAARRVTCRGYAIRCGVVLFVVVLGILPLETSVTSARVRSRAAQAAAVEATSRVEGERARRAEIDVQYAQQARFAATRERTQAWRRILAEIAKAIPEDVWVLEMASEVDGDGVALTLSCRATSLALATDFALTLRRSPLFTSAMLTATASQGEEADPGVRFDCLVRVADGVLSKPVAETAPGTGGVEVGETGPAAEGSE
jgi:hypothetical protein